MPVSLRSRTLSLSLLFRHSCPSCGSEEVRRTHRRTVSDWTLSWLDCRPYRCAGCQRRFHAMPALRALALSSKERRALALRRHAGSGSTAG